LQGELAGAVRARGARLPLADLDNRERNVVGECLRAAVEGPFFPEWEFPALFGLTRDEAANVLKSWPDLDERDESVILAINNSLNNLLGYPYHKENLEWPKFISVTKEEVARIFFKWRGESVRNYFQGLM
jgi:hypothetical protein